MNGFGKSERFVEIPWCLQRHNDAKVALDIGYAHAELEYLQGLAALNIPELHGLDISPPKHVTVTTPTGVVRPLLTPTQADIRSTPYGTEKFELMFCISTIEHIGMDNANYHPGMRDTPSACGDFDTLRELCRITKRGGRLLLSVPFGKYENHGWFQQYDLDRLMRLATSTALELSEVNFFAYRNGWHECYPQELRTVGYNTNGAVAAAGLACLELRNTTHA